jgi:hypothetical protein
LRPVLDQELNRLPDCYRIPIVLCDLEGRSRKQAAAELAIPEGTLSSRLALARKKLAQRLARHDLALSAATLSAVLAHQSASADVPPALVVHTVQAALGLAAGQTATAGVVSARVAALTEGVVNTMLLTRIKMATAVLLAAGFLAASATGLLLQARAAGQAEARNGPKPAEKAKSETASPHADVRKALDRFQAFRPDDRDLTIFQLDWAPTLKEARERAAKQKRPILLMVVTNSYGNLYTGHC